MSKLDSIFSKLKAKEIESILETKDLDYRVDTGSYLLNLQISGKINGGYPAGKSIVLAGDPSCGKTRLMEQAATLFLNNSEDALVLWIDTESALKTDRYKKFGERFRYKRINLIEELRTFLFNFLHFCEKENFVENDIRVLILLDSVGMLTLEAAQKEDKDGYVEEFKSDNMRIAKAKTEFMKSILNKLSKANATLISANHIYTSSNMYGPSHVESGGKMIKYAAHLSLMLQPKAGEEDKESEINKTKSKLIRICVSKGRDVKENTFVEHPIEYDRGGYTRYGGLFDFCVAAKIIEQSGAWYHFKDTETKFRKSDVLKEPEKFFTEDRLKQIEKISERFFLFFDFDQVDPDV